MCSLPHQVPNEGEDSDGDRDRGSDRAVDNRNIDQKPMEYQFADDDRDDRHEQSQEAGDHPDEDARVGAASQSSAQASPVASRRARKTEFVDRGHDQISLHLQYPLDALARGA